MALLTLEYINCLPNAADVLTNADTAALLMKANNPANRAALAKKAKGWYGAEASSILNALSADDSDDDNEAILREGTCCRALRTFFFPNGHMRILSYARTVLAEILQNPVVPRPLMPFSRAASAVERFAFQMVNGYIRP